MSPKQMAERCPGARVHGVGRLKNWRFFITTRGTANVAPAEASQVYGVLWRCGPHHIYALDQYEGVRWGNYVKRIIEVDLVERDMKARVLLYVSSRRYAGRVRPEYLTTAVLPGARAFNLPNGYLTELESWLPRNTIGAAHPTYKGRKSFVRRYI